MVYRPVLLPSVSTSMVYLSICSYVCLFASLLVHCEVAYRSIGCVAKNLLNIKVDNNICIIRFYVIVVS
jgi:hypothetical protein